MDIKHIQHPGQLAIKDFTYDLPESRIAYFPVEKRDESKLLIYKNGTICETVFNKIVTQIPAQSLLVLNNTSVVPARLHVALPSGKIIEIFCLGPENELVDIQSAFARTKSIRWKCLLGGARKWKQGKLIKQLQASDEEFSLTIEKIESHRTHFLLEFVWGNEYSFAEILALCGETPLPPYIKREPVATDQTRYQTVYNKLKGSVAAPTAGLHFTEDVFQSLHAHKVSTTFLTLHVGAGTFMPVKTEHMTGHVMHTENFELPAALLDELIDNIGHIIAVGTTTLRVLESLYWMGLKIYLKPGMEWEQLPIKQWEAYELASKAIPVKDSLNVLRTWMQLRNLKTLHSNTQILIAPGFMFQVASGLVTNFHQPGSTLLLLVAAFVGDQWRDIYTYAMKNNFRFLSYGDSSLLFRKMENV